MYSNLLDKSWKKESGKTAFTKGCNGAFGVLNTSFLSKSVQRMSEVVVRLIKIFISRNKRNVILRGEVYDYLLIKCMGKSRKKLVFAFDGRKWQQYSGISYRISDWFARYIQESGTIPYSNYKKTFQVFDALYRAEDPRETKGQKVWLIKKNPIRFNDYSFMAKDKAKLLRKNHVYEVVAENLQSNQHGSPMFEQAHFKHGAVVGSDGKIRDIKDVAALCKGKEFYTSYDKELYKILCKFTNLEVTNKGVLKTQIKRSKVPFATVVCAFYDNQLTNSDDVLERIYSIQRELSTSHRQIDHLSERKENNYPLLLVPLYKCINKDFRNKRTRIKRPFYFLNLYLYEQHLILVECGIENTSNVFRFKFDISTRKGQQDYYDCFERFRSIAKAAGYITKNPEENLLYCCADPNKFGCKDDPLMGLIYNPLESYSTDTPEVLDVLWDVRGLAGSVADLEDSLGLEVNSITSKLGVLAIQPVTRKLIKTAKTIGLITPEQAAESVQRFCKKLSQNSAVVVNYQ